MFFFLTFRILDSMKLPPQRSGFHISDILELNNDAAKANLHNMGATADIHHMGTNLPGHPYPALHSDTSNAYSQHNLQNPAYTEPSPAYHHLFPAVNRTWNYEGNSEGLPYGETDK
jgi:hypothetical protein